MTVIGDETPAADDLIEIRLLGLFQVRRRDGRCVEEREWRTGKTANLLRLLAMADGAVVPVDQLLNELWPRADEAHGRASLRTAASQVRAVLGGDALERTPAGLALVGAWVDAAAYAQLAGEAQQRAREGEPARCVRAATEAESLRLGPPSPQESSAGMLTLARDEHQAIRLQLLLTGSQAALELGWLADAAELAQRALDQDAVCEQASRTLIRACARLGAGERALREFDRCRRALADELGVDPSPATQDLHLEILSGLDTDAAVSPPAPRRREGDWLHALISGAAGSTAPLVVHLVGDTASERHDLLAAVCAGAGAQHLTATGLTVGLQRLAQRSSTIRVIHVEGESGRVRPPAGLAGPAVIVLGSDDHPQQPSGVVVDLRPLHREELHLLAEQMLGERPDSSLLTALAARCGNSHHEAVRTLQAWLREGRIHASGRGMLLLDVSPGASQESARTRMARTVERLSAQEQEVLAALAVLDRASSAEEVAAVLSDPDEPAPALSAKSVAHAIDRLADLGLLGTQDGHRVLRDPLLADAVRSWLRSSALRRLHRAVAERGRVSSAERVEHWLAVGEPELACAAALEAAGAALGEERLEDARTHLLQVCSLADVEIDLSQDATDLASQLADVFDRLDRPEDAARARLHLQPAPAPPLLRQLPRIVLSAGTPPVPPAPYRRRKEDASPLGAPVADGCAAAWQQEWESVLPMPSLPALVRPGAAGSAIAPALVELLLGSAASAEERLLALRELVSPDSEPAVSACLDLLISLVDHDLGRPRPELGHDHLRALVAQAGADWSWVPLRLCGARFDLPGALRAEAAATVPPEDQSELGNQLRLLGTAAVRVYAGAGPTGAIAPLTELVDSALSSGCTLLLPEGAALLALSEAALGLSTVQEHFDLFEWSVGARDARPRASALRLLARAAVRSAAGDHRRAASAAAQAAQLASASRLVPLAAHAALARAGYLIADGSAEAVTAMTLARAAFRSAGIEPPAPDSVRPRTHHLSIDLTQGTASDQESQPPRMVG